MKKEELNKLYADWCKDTKRNGGVVVGASVREFFDYVESKTEVKEIEVEEVPVLVGSINKAFGMRGYDPIKVGTPVFQDRDKYVVLHKKVNSEEEVPIQYYKDTLQSFIKFN